MMEGVPDFDVLSLADRYEIAETIARYARAVDGRNLDLFDDCFTPDVIVDHGKFGGVLRGLQALKAMEASVNVRCNLSGTFHLIAPPAIKIDENGVVRAESYVIAQHIRHELAPDSLFISGAKFYDVLQHMDNRWLVSHRVTRSNWSDGNPAVLGIDRPPRAPVAAEPPPPGW